MSQLADPIEELGVLAAALCDGEITPEQAARLEQIAQESPEARRRLLFYIQLHGELLWDHATSLQAECPAPPELAAVSQQPANRFARRHWVAIAVAASMLVAICWWAVPGRLRAPATVAAHLTRSIGAVWQGKAKADGTALSVGDKLELDEGLAEITFACGTRVILEGPASLEMESSEGGYLAHGSLTAHVAGPSKRFAVRTPSLTVVDLGTEFGVAAEANGPSEVRVFTGKVQVRPQSGTASGGWQLVSAGGAVRVPLADRGRLPDIETIHDGGRQFIQKLPPPDAGSVAALRALVREHPRLIHHYPFEGVTPQEQRRDKRGSLDLTEAVMQSGRGNGQIAYAGKGWDSTTRSVRPYRAGHNGNVRGVGLQSESTFQPPKTMTVELLVKFTPSKDSEEGAIECAVATRADEQHCAFFLAAVEQGQLTHLMDKDADWVETHDDFSFEADAWYYVVSTFAVESGATRVNTYVANLSRGERKLTWVVRDQLTPGTPAASRLGVGKGFDQSTAHAYPWSGALDEVAIYDTVLDRQAIEEHLAALVGPSHEGK